MSDFSMQTVLDAAERHGKDEDPDHEIGDLQDAFRVAYGLMGESEIKAFAESDSVENTLELGWYDGETPDLLENLITAAKQHGDDSGEPDHEAGDLQDLLNDAWEHMEPATRAAFAKHGTIVHNIAVANVDLDVITPFKK